MAPKQTTAGHGLAALQNRLGYQFADQQLLHRALTHKSAGTENFERFEFLGDAALGFIVGRTLYDAMPDASEHRLTLMRASLVRGDSLAVVAKTLDLGAFLYMGTGERKSGVATRTSILADALEAVLGAIVCDGGLESAATVTKRIFSPLVWRTSAAPTSRTPRPNFRNTCKADTSSHQPTSCSTTTDRTTNACSRPFASPRALACAAKAAVAVAAKPKKAQLRQYSNC